MVDDNSLLSFGNSYTLEVSRLTDHGALLDARNLGSVLLPASVAPTGLARGDSVSVFLYFDSDDRPVATTRQPRAKVGECAYLEAVANTDFGTFLDWGLDKDVLVPFAEQHRPMVVGRSYLVRLYLNDVDGRITASSRIDRFIDDVAPPGSYQSGEAVRLVIGNSTQLGFKAIVNHRHWGVLYQNEVHQRLSFGQSIDGYIKRLRPDGKIDLTLQGGRTSRSDHATRIEAYLREHGGFAPVHDKSDPQLIARLFSMSKGAFKKAIGGLYKSRIIAIEKNGIRLLDPPE